MKLVVYLRVSGRGQVKDGYGLETQLRECRAWARANGHKIVKVCSDEGLSGTLPADERPGLACALEMLHERHADGLLISRLDRFAREVTVQEATLAVVWRHDHQVFTADSGEVLQDDPDDPMRTAMRQMAGVFNGLDRRMTVKKLRDGRARKAAEGRHAVGVYPYGSRGEGKGRERDAAPDDAEQQVLARILELRAAGKSYREVCAALEADGVPTRRGGPWQPATVRKYALRASA
jgi:DNA invertase Pin-like site-specific DNA recombinase